MEKRHFSNLIIVPVAKLKGVKLLGVTICAVFLPIPILLSLFSILAQVFLQRKCLCHRSGEEWSVNIRDFLVYFFSFIVVVFLLVVLVSLPVPELKLVILFVGPKISSFAQSLLNVSAPGKVQ